VYKDHIDCHKIEVIDKVGHSSTKDSRWR